MIRDANCTNKHWRKADLETLVEQRVYELLQSPEIAQDLIEVSRQKSISADTEGIEVEKRLGAIDREIKKFMELYRIDGIPPEILAENIKKLYAEKTALEAQLKSANRIPATPFDLVEELLYNATQVWNFADLSQKRRILQDLIDRIIIDGKNVKIEWSFAK